MHEKLLRHAERVERLTEKIRDIPDFPKPGILFKDITTLLCDPVAFNEAIDLMCQPYRTEQIDYMIGIEARGFIFASAMAHALNAGFIPVRKKGKLPAATIDATYQLEYGTDSLSIHADAIHPGSRVVIVDDLLATGGTIGAVIDLMEKMQATVLGVSCLIELSFLHGREKVAGHPFHAVIQY